MAKTASALYNTPFSVQGNAEIYALRSIVIEPPHGVRALNSLIVFQKGSQYCTLGGSMILSLF